MITLDQAKKALEASEAKASELGIAVTTTIVDEHGTIIAVSKMDNAFVVSPNFAYAKAYTSATLQIGSGDLGPYMGDGKPFIFFNTLAEGQFTGIAGGLPVSENGKVIGAIGVGGSRDVNQDIECAQSALSVLLGHQASGTVTQTQEVGDTTPATQNSDQTQTE